MASISFDFLEISRAVSKKIHDFLNKSQQKYSRGILIAILFCEGDVEEFLRSIGEGICGKINITLLESNIDLYQLSVYQVLSTGGT